MGRVRRGAYPANIIVTNLVSTIIPITLGYAVIRHRVMGIDVALRRGIQYLLARGTLRVFLMLPFVAIAANVAAHPERTIQDVVAQSPLYGYGSAILAATLSLKFRQPLTAWVDRRFFREAYDREGMLFELIQRIKAAESLPEISTATGDQLNAAIHPRNLHILCRQGETERFFPVYSSIGCSLEIRLSGDDRLVERPARAFQSSVVSVALERRGPFMCDA